ncbi:predicted protein [Nematostella vectensis]|uniref:G-protein coupled receptors family 1 profile domain-containing protein n=1 Tax=Nematostella vectensis TaxID=45351 RepID=A7SU66_NEMVE|nr:histamine H2 receptor [Nematostella vectensis]EDO32749.1 predicted protein [Nematostella vectensis]|eukprot:XP_001624849.1 predicted protein [Nematostella vectensis]
MDIPRNYSQTLYNSASNSLTHNNSTGDSFTLNNSTSISLASPFWCVAFACQGILILFSNIVTIVTFWLNKHLRKRSVFLLINLSVADFLVGLLPVPLYVYFVGVGSGFWPPPSPALQNILTHIFTYVDIFLGLTSIVTLACISLERMRATVWPLRHRMTTNRMYSGVICLTWVFAALIASLATYIKTSHVEYDIYAAWMSVSILLVSLCIILVSYSFVFASFRRSGKRNRSVGHVNKTIYRDNRLAITLFLVTIASLLAWVPFVVLNGIYYYTDIKFTYTVQNVVKLLHYMNSLINTVIYASRMAEFKRALFHFMFKCSRLNEDSPPPTTKIPLSTRNGDTPGDTDSERGSPVLSMRTRSKAERLRLLLHTRKCDH